MLETSARLLRLLSLFQARRYWSGSDLAERLEVTNRTLRRDVDKLRSLGYPIHSSSGVEGGYQLGAGSTMPPLLLDDQEAVAVAFGLRLAATGSIQGVEEASLRALAKIEQLLPARLAAQVSALQAVVVASHVESSVDAAVLSALAAGCRDRQMAQFRYLDHAGRSSIRSVEPHRLVCTGRRWYLVAWDAARKDWRTFRVDRVQQRIRPGERFAPRELPAKDLAAYVSRGVWQSWPCRARIKLFAPAESIAQRLPPGIGMLEAVDPQSCYLETSASSYASLAMHLSLLDVDFEVTEPDELVDQVGRLGRRYRAAARC